MNTALGAYTPNVPWAQIACGKVSDITGREPLRRRRSRRGGRAWLAEHWDRVKQFSQPWMRVEAVRWRSVRSAQKFTDKMSASETKEKSARACAADARWRSSRRPKPNSESCHGAASWSWLNHDFCGGVSFCNWRRTVAHVRKCSQTCTDADGAALRKIDEAIDDPDRRHKICLLPPGTGTWKPHSMREIRRGRSAPCWKPLGRRRLRKRRTTLEDRDRSTKNSQASTRTAASRLRPSIRVWAKI